MAEESGIGVGAPDASIIFGVDIRAPLEGFSVLEKKMADFKAAPPVAVRFAVDLPGLKTQLSEAQVALNAANLQAPVRLNLMEGSVTAMRAEVAAMFATQPITVPVIMQAVHGGGAASVASSMVNPANSPSAAQAALQARRREQQMLQGMLSSLPTDVEARRHRMASLLSNLSNGPDDILGPTLMARGGRRPGAGRPRNMVGPPNPYLYDAPSGPSNPYQYPSSIGPSYQAPLRSPGHVNVRSIKDPSMLGPMYGPAQRTPGYFNVKEIRNPNAIGPLHGPYFQQPNALGPHYQYPSTAGPTYSPRNGPFLGPHMPLGARLPSNWTAPGPPPVVPPAPGFLSGLRGRFNQAPEASYARDMGRLQEQARREFFAGNTLIRGFTLPALAVAGGTGLMSARMESKMAHIQGLTQQSRGMTKWMQGGIYDATLKDNIGAEDRAEGLYQISSTGFKGAAAMKILETASKGAAAGMGDVNTIADLQTTILSAYGQSAEKAAHNQDVLTQMVVFGKGEATQYAAALGKVIPMASMLGVSLEEVAASLATMSRVGIKPAEGATALNQLITHIAAPTKQAKEQLAKLGSSPAQLRNMVKLQGLNYTLGDLYQKGTSGGQAGIDTFETLFGNVRGLKGFLSTTATQPDAYKEGLNQMKNAAGATDRALAAVADSAEFQFGRALNAVKRTAYSIGDTVLPWLTKKFEGFADSAPKAFDRISNSWADLGEVPGGKAVQAGVGLAGAGLALAGPMFYAGALVKDVKASKMMASMVGRSAGLTNKLGVIGASMIAARYLDSNFGLLGGVTDGPASFMDSDAGNVAMLAGGGAWAAAKYGRPLGGAMLSGGSRLSAMYTAMRTPAAAASFANTSAAGRAALGLAPLVPKAGLTGAGFFGAATGAGLLGAGVLGAAIGVGGMGVATYSQSRDRALTERYMQGLNVKDRASDVMKTLDSASGFSMGDAGISTRVDALREKIVSAGTDTVQLGSALRDIDKISFDVKEGKVKMDPLAKQLFLNDFEKLKAQTASLTIEVGVKPNSSYEDFMQDLEKGLKAVDDDLKAFTVNGVLAGNLEQSEAAKARWEAAANNGGAGSPGFTSPTPSGVIPFFAGKAPKGKTPEYVAPFFQNLIKPLGKQQDLFQRLTGLSAGTDEDVIERIKGWDSTNPQARAALNLAVAKLNRNPSLVAGNGLENQLGKTLRAKLLEFNKDRIVPETEVDDGSAGRQAEANALREQVEVLQTQKDALGETKQAWDSFGSSIENTVGRLAGFADKSNQAAMESMMLKRNVDEVGTSFKIRAVELASYIDRLTYLKNGQGALKGLVGGMEGSLVNAGGDPALLSPMMKNLNKLLPFTGNIKGLQGDALIKGRELAEAAQSESDRLEQSMKDLTAQIKALNDTISGLESAKGIGSAGKPSAVSGDILATAQNMVGMTGSDAMAAGKAKGKEWCVGFAQEVNKGATGHYIEGNTNSPMLSVSGMIGWAKKNGKAYSQQAPNVGDYVAIKNVGNTKSHFAIVKSVSGDKFTTIGGNEGAKNNYASKVKDTNSYSWKSKGITFIKSGSVTAAVIPVKSGASVKETADTTPTWDGKSPIPAPKGDPVFPSPQVVGSAGSTSAVNKAGAKKYVSGRGKSFQSSKKIRNRTTDPQYTQDKLAFSGADYQLSQYNTKWLDMLPEGFRQYGDFDPNRPQAKELQTMLMGVGNQEQLAKGVAQIRMKNFKGTPEQYKTGFQNTYAGIMGANSEQIRKVLNELAGGANVVDSYLKGVSARGQMAEANFGAYGDIYASNNLNDPLAGLKFNTMNQPHSVLSKANKQTIINNATIALRNRQAAERGESLFEQTTQNQAAGISYRGLMNTGSSQGGAYAAEQFLTRRKLEQQYKQHRGYMTAGDFNRMIDEQLSSSMEGSDVRRQTDYDSMRINRGRQSGRDMQDARYDAFATRNRVSSSGAAVYNAGVQGFRSAYDSAYDKAISDNMSVQAAKNYAQAEGEKQRAVQEGLEAVRQSTLSLREHNAAMEGFVTAGTNGRDSAGLFGIAKNKNLSHAQFTEQLNAASRSGIYSMQDKYAGDFAQVGVKSQSQAMANMVDLLESRRAETIARMKEDNPNWNSQDEDRANAAIDSDLNQRRANTTFQKILEEAQAVSESKTTMEDSIIARNEEMLSTMALTKEQKVAVAIIKATNDAMRRGIGPGKALEEIRSNAAKGELARIQQEKQAQANQYKMGIVGSFTSAADAGIDALLAGKNPQNAIAQRQQEYQWLSMKMDLKDQGFGKDSREYKMAERQFKAIKNQAPDDSALGRVKSAFGTTLGDGLRKVSSDALKKTSADIIGPWIGNILGIKTADTTVGGENAPGVNTQIANITAQTVNLTGANVYVNGGGQPGGTQSIGTNGSGRPGAMTPEQAGMNVLGPLVGAIFGGRG